MKRNRREYSKARYEEHGERLREESKVRRRTKNGVINTIYQTQIRTSKARGHDRPTYALSELREWVLSQEIFHVLHDKWVESNYDKYSKPSLDRKDDYLGYSFDNIQIMTWKENDDKGSEDNLSGKNKKKWKPVIMTQDGGDTMFESIKKAQEFKGVSTKEGNIGSCCRGVKKTAYGATWRYYES